MSNTIRTKLTRFFTIKNISVFFSIFGFLNLLLYCSFHSVPFPVERFLYLDIIISSIFFFFVFELLSPIFAAHMVVRSSDAIKSKTFKYIYSVVSIFVLCLLYYIYYRYIVSQLADIYGFGGVPPYERYLNIVGTDFYRTFFHSMFLLNIVMLFLSIIYYLNGWAKHLIESTKPFIGVVVSLVLISYTISPLPEKITGFSLRVIGYGDFLRYENNIPLAKNIVKKFNIKHDKNLSGLIIKFIIKEDGGYFCKIYTEDVIGKNTYSNKLAGNFFVTSKELHKYGLFL